MMLRTVLEYTAMAASFLGLLKYPDSELVRMERIVLSAIITSFVWYLEFTAGSTYTYELFSRICSMAISTLILLSPGVGSSKKVQKNSHLLSIRQISR